LLQLISINNSNLPSVKRQLIRLNASPAALKNRLLLNLNLLTISSKWVMMFPGA